MNRTFRFNDWSYILFIVQVLYPVLAYIKIPFGQGFLLYGFPCKFEMKTRNMCSIVGRGGGTPEHPPPKSEKLLQKSGFIIQRYILSERNKKSKKYLVRNVKKSIFHRDVDQKNLEIFLKFFKVFFAQGFAGRFLNLPCPMENILEMLMIFHFSTKFSLFSPKISRIYIQFPIVLLYLRHLSSFFLMLLGISLDLQGPSRENQVF